VLFLFRLIWLLFEQIDTYQFGWMKIVKKLIRIFGFNSSKFLCAMPLTVLDRLYDPNLFALST